MAPQQMPVSSDPTRAGVRDQENNRTNQKSKSTSKKVHYVHDSSLLCCNNYQNRSIGVTAHNFQVQSKQLVIVPMIIKLFTIGTMIVKQLNIGTKILKQLIIGTIKIKSLIIGTMIIKQLNIGTMIIQQLLICTMISYLDYIQKLCAVTRQYRF